MTNENANKCEPLIRKLERFGPLQEADKALLNDICEDARSVPARSDLIREGEIPHGVFLVLEGFAGRYKLQAAGARHIVAYLLPGDFCDLDVAFLPRMDHSIGTLSSCLVVHIPTETVCELMRRPDLARALRMATLVETATARAWLINAGRRSATGRFAHLFCELHMRLAAVGSSGEDGYELPLTQYDLADTVGLSVVHTNRSLQILRSEGLIELRSKHLTIVDMPRLRDLAEFRPGYLHLEDRAAA